LFSLSVSFLLTSNIFSTAIGSIPEVSDSIILATITGILTVGGVMTGSLLTYYFNKRTEERKRIEDQKHDTTIKKLSLSRLKEAYEYAKFIKKIADINYKSIDDQDLISLRKHMIAAESFDVDLPAILKTRF
jgi:hypothetical protein